MLRFIPFLLFVGIPIMEIGLFIAVGGHIGLLPTLLIVVATAILGTALLRQQGFSVFQRAQREMNAGKIPVARIADGLFLLVAAVLLLTPGFLTDMLGFLLFVPNVRRAIGQRVFTWFVGAPPDRSAPADREPDDRHDPGIINGEAIEIDVHNTGR